MTQVLSMATDASDDESRLDQRSHVFLMAVLSCGSRSWPVRVRNLSTRGALLELDGLLGKDQVVSLKRGSLSAKGRVAWTAGQRCGLRFSKPIHVSEWVERAGPVRQQRIDAAIADYRRRAVQASNAVQSFSHDRDQLEELSARLLQSCERLAELPGLSIEVAEELLKIEAMAYAVRDLEK